MNELNTDIQSDMKIDVRITWADIFVAIMAWFGEFISAPLRSQKAQGTSNSTPEALSIETR